MRELIILQVCATTGSEYERVHHTQIASASGVDSEQIAAVNAGRLNSPALVELAPLLTVVDRLVRNHGIDRDDFDTLADRLGARRTVELLLVVGFYLGHALFTSALDLDVEPASGVATQKAACPPDRDSSRGHDPGSES